MKSKIEIIVLSALIMFPGCRQADKAISVKFDGEHQDQNLTLKELNSSLPSNWEKAEYLTFDFRSSTTQRFDLKLYDTAGLRLLTIQPMQGPWVRASIPLRHFRSKNTRGMDMAAIWKTPRPGYWIGFSSEVGTLGCIDSIGVSMQHPVGSPTLELKNVTLTMTAQDTIFGPRPLVDEFGQWIPAEWSGKAQSADDLRASREAEEKELQREAGDISRYGGFTRKKVTGTGFFRVQQIDGKWWFIDPDG